MVAGRDPTSYYSVVGGACLEIVLHDDAWRGVTAILPESPKGQVVGRIVCGGPLLALPDGPPDFVDVLQQARGWTLRSDPMVVFGAAHARFEPGLVSITAPTGRASEAFDRVLPVTLSWLLGLVRLWVVHAAVVVEPEGSAIVAFGPSGGGKSTVAAAALAAGWPVPTDDLAVIRLSPGGLGTLEVCGVALPLAIPSEFPHLGQAIPGDIRFRRRVSADAASAGWWPIGQVVVLAHGVEAVTTIEPLGALDAFRVIRTSHFTADVASRRAEWFAVAGTLARLPSSRLALGTRADVRLATLIESLDRATALTATGKSPPPH
jgi:hypothetical protein